MLGSLFKKLQNLYCCEPITKPLTPAYTGEDQYFVSLPKHLVFIKIMLAINRKGHPALDTQLQENVLYRGRLSQFQGPLALFLTWQVVRKEAEQLDVDVHILLNSI